MAGKRDRKLKNYLVSNDIQLRIIASTLLYMMVVIMLTGVVVLYPLVLDMFYNPDLEIQYRAALTMLGSVKRLVPAVLAILALGFIHQLIITHRICGPLVNFTNTFRRISEGDLTRKIILRHGDYLKKECRSINEMIDGLAEKIMRIDKNHRRLKELLDKTLEHSKNPDARNMIKESLEILRKEAEATEADIVRFKLKFES